MRFVLILSLFFLAGCSRLEAIDKKLGEVFFSASSTFTAGFDRASSSGFLKEGVDPKNLTKEQKDKIESWLEKNGLNRYGDRLGAYYASGTPLFDEAGKAIERYEYIIKNHPEIFD